MKNDRMLGKSVLAGVWEEASPEAMPAAWHLPSQCLRQRVGWSRFETAGDPSRKAVLRPVGQHRSCCTVNVQPTRTCLPEARVGTPQAFRANSTFFVLV
eukprot:285089-Rhodomonas_salina.1